MTQNVFPNPFGLSGFDFVEFSSPEPAAMADMFARMGFAKVATHKTANVDMYRQGDITFFINMTPNSAAVNHAAKCGPCATAMGFRVNTDEDPLALAISRGAKEFTGQKTLNLPAIEGIGGTAVYLVSNWKNDASDHYADFDWITADRNPKGIGLTYLDHITNNVLKGRMNHWADFYESIFGFREIRYFDIKGEYTGLNSRAMSAPCPRMAIPINEDKGTGEKAGQIDRYLQEMQQTEGMQHFAFGCDDIYSVVDSLRAGGVDMMPPPPSTYYDMLGERLGDHGEEAEELRKRGILLDGNKEQQLLLQIFSKEEQGPEGNKPFGPAFFEFIQRKGDEGFGEGNFQALFESIERAEQDNK